MSTYISRTSYSYTSKPLVSSEVRTSRLITTTETKDCPVEKIPVTTEVRTSRIIPTTEVRTSRIIPTTEVRNSRVYSSNGVRSSRLVTTTEIEDCPVEKCPVKTEIRTSRIIPTTNVRTSQRYNLVTQVETEDCPVGGCPVKTEVRTSRIIPTYEVRTSQSLPQSEVRISRVSYNKPPTKTSLTNSLKEVKFEMKSGEIKSAKFDQDEDKEDDKKSLADSDVSIDVEPLDDLEEKPVFARFNEKKKEMETETEKVPLYHTYVSEVTKPVFEKRRDYGAYGGEYVYSYTSKTTNSSYNAL